MRQALLLLIVCSFGCVASPEEVGERSDAIIYGDDDRLEVEDHPDALLQDIARRSVGALVDRRLVDPSGGAIRAATWGQRVEATFGVPYCEDAPHGVQPSAADCSGVLIDDDLFLTAAHCVPTQDFCDDYSVVFGWYNEGGMPRLLTSEDVYDCDRIAVISYLRDYAIIQLDRVVGGGHSPALVREGPDRIRPGDFLSIIGHSGGTPMKIDDAVSGGPAYDPGIESFLFKGDTLPGVSGAPILNRMGEVIGVVSRTQVETFDVGRDCVAIEQTTDADDPFEIGGYVFRAMHDLCRRGLGFRNVCADPGAWCEGECAGGGGGCAAAPAEGFGGGALLLLGALLVRRRRR